MPPEEQYSNGEELKVATMRVIEGVRIFNSPLPAAQGNEPVDCRLPVASSVTDPKPQRIPWKGKSVWAGKEGEINVEELALEHYATLGFRG